MEKTATATAMLAAYDFAIRIGTDSHGFESAQNPTASATDDVAAISKVGADYIQIRGCAILQTVL